MLPIQAIQMKLHFDYNITEKEDDQGVYKIYRSRFRDPVASSLAKAFLSPETEEERKRRIEAEERRTALDKQKAAIKQLNRTPVKNTGRLSRSSSNNNRVIMNPDSPSNRVPPGIRNKKPTNTRYQFNRSLRYGTANRVPTHNKYHFNRSLQYEK